MIGAVAAGAMVVHARVLTGWRAAAALAAALVAAVSDLPLLLGSTAAGQVWSLVAFVAPVALLVLGVALLTARGQSTAPYQAFGTAHR